MANRKDKPTYERLYGLNKDKKDKEEAELKAAEQSKMKSPNRKMDQGLYEEAKRREIKNAKKKEEYDKIKDKPKEKMFKNELSN